MTDFPDAPWQGVLDFWFLPASAPGYGQPRGEWFRKDAAFDATIIRQFGNHVESALAGGLMAWDATPPGALARILLLDQFTRNSFRDTPRAFAGDAQAVHAAQAMRERGDDLRLPPLQRWFIYLPFMHAEDNSLQDLSVALFQRLHAETGEFAGPLDFAQRHRDIVARFGRFPHRNAILGRIGTPEEIEFLKLPGSGF